MRTALGIIGIVLGVLAGATCITAGIYLLSMSSQAAIENGRFDGTMFDVLQHGIGVYAIGKGVAILGRTSLDARPKLKVLGPS